MRKAFLAYVALMMVGVARADSIYLCKSYGGATFWASGHCSLHSAHIERIVNVPNGLPWEQKVSLAEQEASQRRAAESSVSQPVVSSSVSASAANQSECEALDAQIVQLDAMARQPQSGQTQDWIASQRKKARDRQFQIRCQ